MSTPRQILETAIAAWNPVAVICLYSGGYDSLVMTHVVQQIMRTPVWSIDTNLSADGWRAYVEAVAAGQGWDHHVYDNQAGADEFTTMVRQYGCPRSRTGHRWAYVRLKDRAINAILRQTKTSIHDKVLFLSGIRQVESRERMGYAEAVHRRGHSNAIFANPLLYWTNEHITRYRWKYDLPENPFYATVRGSGDCQCNWGNFITLDRLRQYSPQLADGRVADLDRLSRQFHGYGWDGTRVTPEPPLPAEETCAPFLCATCSRDKGGRVAASEFRTLQTEDADEL